MQRRVPRPRHDRYVSSFESKEVVSSGMKWVVHYYVYYWYWYMVQCMMCINWSVIVGGRGMGGAEAYPDPRSCH